MKSLYPYLLSLFTLLVPLAARSQTETITKNPKAVRLREIWGVRGHEPDEYVGNGVGGGFDVNNDGLGDFAVRSGAEWRVYYGDAIKLNDTVRWTFRATGASSNTFVVGDFYGTGRKAIGVTRDSCNNVGQCSLRVHIFRTDDGYLPDTPATIIDTKLQFCLRGWQAVDLDGDGADELILFRSCGAPYYNEIWIYRGGPDFNGDEPTVIIRDPELPILGAPADGAAGDIDGDGVPDLLMTSEFSDGKWMKIYWGNRDDPWDWNNPPRTVELDLAGTPGGYLTVKTLDCDGDGLLDIWIEERDGNSHLYRSRVKGKNARTRPFRGDDTDQMLASPTYGIWGSLGFLNDSNRRYEMIALRGAEAGTAQIFCFSGGPNGPDSAYDAWARDDLSSVFASRGIVTDCDGDGWPEIIVANSGWYSGLNFGKAVILAGGPEIPRDFPTSGVRDLPLEDKQRAVSLWPNPVHDELNIAWRGDLRHMPARFEVHDLLGGLVATGSVEPWRGAALWHCDDVPAGTYILSIRDAGGMLLTTASIIKQ